jgi:hypothetical protein
MGPFEFPPTYCAHLVLTCFENPEAWKSIREQVRAPVPAHGGPFQANVQFIDDSSFQGLSTGDLLARLPPGYRQSFLLVADAVTLASAEFPILVIDLRRQRGRTFRAIPSAIQSIENNLSIANMDFFEFADAADADGIFRGFSGP